MGRFANTAYCQCPVGPVRLRSDAVDVFSLKSPLAIRAMRPNAKIVTGSSRLVKKDEVRDSVGEPSACAHGGRMR